MLLNSISIVLLLHIFVVIENGSFFGLYVTAPDEELTPNFLRFDVSLTSRHLFLECSHTFLCFECTYVLIAFPLVKVLLTSEIFFALSISSLKESSPCCLRTFSGEHSCFSCCLGFNGFYQLTLYLKKKTLQSARPFRS